MRLSDTATRRLVIGLAFTGFVGWLWSSQMWNVYFDDTLHRHSDIAAGRVNVENMHGIPIYTTNREHLLLHGLSALSMGLFILACLLDWFQRRKPTESAGGGKKPVRQ